MDDGPCQSGADPCSAARAGRRRTEPDRGHQPTERGLQPARAWGRAPRCPCANRTTSTGRDACAIANRGAPSGTGPSWERRHPCRPPPARHRRALRVRLRCLGPAHDASVRPAGPHDDLDGRRADPGRVVGREPHSRHEYVCERRRYRRSDHALLPPGAMVPGRVDFGYWPWGRGRANARSGPRAAGRSGAQRLLHADIPSGARHCEPDEAAAIH